MEKMQTEFSKQSLLLAELIKACTSKHDSGNWNYGTIKELIEETNDDVTFEELNNYVHLNKELAVSY